MAIAGRDPEPGLDVAFLDLVEGMLHARAGQLDEALALVERSVNAYSQRGRRHPNALLAALWHAMVNGMRGDFERCRELGEAALEQIVAVRGPDHPQTGSAHEVIGNAHAGLGEIESAVASHQEALRILKRTHKPRAPVLFAATNNISAHLARLGDMTGAVEYAEEALAIADENYSPTHLAHVRARLTVAELRTDLGAPEVADALLDGACADAAKVGDAAAKQVLSACLVLRTYAALANENPEAGVRFGEQSVAALHGVDFAERPLTDAHFGLATALQRQGQLDRAVTEAKRALQFAEKTESKEKIDAARGLLDQLRTP